MVSLYLDSHQTFQWLWLDTLCPLVPEARKTEDLLSECYGLNVCSLQYSRWHLFAIEMVFGGETFKRCLCHESRAFPNGLMLLLWEWVCSSALSLIFLLRDAFHHSTTQQEEPHQMPAPQSQTSQTPELWSSKFLFIKNDPVCGILL